MHAGGSWDFMMHGPDGRDYPNRIIFIEIVQPERIIYRHSGDDDTEPVNFHVTVTFGADGNKTMLTMLSVFTSAEELQRVNTEYGAVQGTTDTANRLEEYLVNIKTGLQAGFEISAPVQHVFNALTANINEWWTATMEGHGMKTGDTFTVRFGNTYKTFMLEDMSPGKKIIWKCIAAYIDMQALENRTEWLGTKIIWELAEAGNSTKVEMIHYGLTPLLDCYSICEQGWAQFLLSLQNYITTGIGSPYTVTNTAVTGN